MEKLHDDSTAGLIDAFTELTPLTNSALAGIYLQRDGVLHFVNDRLASLLGRPASDLIGTEWIQFVVEEDRDPARGFSAGGNGGSGNLGQALECRIHGADGVRWVMASGQTVELNGSSPVKGKFTAGYVIDITEYKLVEERLRNALSLHAATIESTTDGIVVLNRAREIVSHNQRFADIWNLENIMDMAVEDVRRAMGLKMVNLEAFRAVLRRTIGDPSSKKWFPSTSLMVAAWRSTPSLVSSMVKSSAESGAGVT